MPCGVWIMRGDSPQNSCRSSFPFFPGKERKRSKGKKPPPGQNSPVLRGRRRSALNAYVERDVKLLMSCSGTYHLRPRDASAPPPSAAPSGRGTGEFCTGGPPCTAFRVGVESGNSGLKIIEGRHQPGPRFEARTFVLETFYKHRASKRQTSLRSFANCGVSRYFYKSREARSL